MRACMGAALRATLTALATLATLTSGLLLTTAARAQSTLWLHPPAVAEVAWRGMLPTEGEGVAMGTQLVYPVYGAVGLLAAIFTHAAISQGAQSAQRQKLQDDADRVLDVYRPLLNDWPAQALWDATLAAAATALSAHTDPAAGLPLKPWQAAGAGAEPSAVAVPVFTLSQDEAVLVADVAIKLQPAPAAGAPTLELMVRVVAAPPATTDVRAHWTADQAQRLKARAAAMLAHALAVAHHHGASAAPDTPARTHRYLQGSIERSERAHRLGGDCARVVLRTLRGGLLSVPLKPPEEGTCKAVSPI